MQRRLPLALAVIVVALIALLGSVDAMAVTKAFAPPGSPPTRMTKKGWTITLKSISETRPGWWDWWWEVENESGSPPSGLEFLAMLIPDCNTKPKIKVDLSKSALFKEYFDVAQGEPTLGFGRYNEQVRVAKGYPDKHTHWHLITNTNQMSQSTIILKMRRIGVLTFEMAGPGCSPEPPVISMTSLSFTTVDEEGNKYLIEINKDQSGNILSIWRTRPDGKRENITAKGIPWKDIFVRYPGSPPGGEPIRFIPDDTTSKTGYHSTCGYWYRGVFWNFCGKNQ